MILAAFESARSALLAAALLSPPRLEPAACPFANQPWAATVRADCHWLVVPQDRARPGGPSVRLFVVVLRAAQPSEKPPLVMLHGGPGASALLPMVRNQARPTLDRDVVIYDQRGAGLSQPDPCPQLARRLRELSPAGRLGDTADVAMKTVARECVASMRSRGIEPGAFTTSANVADLIDLRRALGIRRWDVLGESYGGRLALEAMRRDAGAIRSLVLARPVPPGPFRAEAALSTQRALERVFAACERSSACHAALPTSKEAFLAVFDTLDKTPVPISPADSNGVQLVIDGDRFAGAVRRLLRSRESIAWLPLLIHELQSGDRTRAARELVRLSGSASGTPDRAVFWLVDCADQAGPDYSARLDSVRSAAWRALRSLGSNLAECPLWQSRVAERDERAPVESDIPTLILAGELDPVAPVELGQRIAATLPNSFLFVQPGETHDQRPTACRGRILEEFWNDPRRKPDASCLALMPPIEFRTEWPSASGRAAVAQTATPPTALVDVTVIDEVGVEPRAHSTILIQGERIAAIFPTGSRPLPAGAATLALAGRFVIPGLIDTHVHVASDPAGEDTRPRTERRLRVALLGGVTTVRDMAGDARALASLSRDALLGSIPSPDLYYAALFAGPAFFSDPRTQAAAQGAVAGEASWMRAITSATDLRQVVADARGTGATAIKLYAALDSTLARRITEEAHRQTMRVWAHVALNPATPLDVMRAGVDVASHADMLWFALSKPSADSALKATRTAKSFEPTFPELDSVLAVMVRHGAILEPTLFVAAASRPVPRVFGSPETRLAFTAAITRRAHHMGVTLSAGTDTLAGVDDTLPNLHEELALLVERAGLTPAEALRAATRNAAQAIGVLDSRGTIEVGKLADLVVLRADPLHDIHSTRSVELVVKHGRIYRRDAAMPASASAQTAPPPAPVRPVTDTLHGVAVTDPYRWMEAGGPELEAWLRAQDAYTRAVLARIPGREKVLAEMRALNTDATTMSRVERIDGEYF